MATELLINARSYETRVAVIENNILAELHVERPNRYSLAGNIYKGRVVRVLPGMQAAFVDIGLERAAFLYITDVTDNFEEFEAMMKEEEEDQEQGLGDLEEELEEKATYPHPYFNIEDLLNEGQELLVQVVREPVGSKGARITTHVSLPGRHLVLMPTMDHIGISRRIENENERKKLRELLSGIKPDGFGLIARTASEGVTRDKIKTEMDFLIKLWNNIQQKMPRASISSLIHQDLNISLRAVRDLFTKEVDRLVIDSRPEYDQILEFIDNFMPKLKYLVHLYEGKEPLFDGYGIEVEVGRALGKKVWLKSGGYIVIEATEALTSIDVNTGRYVGKRNLEETIIKTNLEAVKEIAYQLRLRNIGGVVVIDFIDMLKKSDREKVFNALKEALKRDKNKTNVLKMSELGLIEMTRKRTRENLTRLFREPCFYCEGEGWLKSKNSICYQIFQQIEREAWEMPGDSMILQVHPEIAGLLLDEEHPAMEELEQRIGKRISVESKEAMHLEQYKIYNEK
ncbi:MAG: Rne/Rng family ribonuclease, partial [Deltaproteobacteria bacterium]|nr:Rne/Rng family ribonuclease [Deltaproteobacteria bacterium]